MNVGLNQNHDGATCIFFALKREARPFLRRFRVCRPVPIPHGQGWDCHDQGRSVRVVVAGVGVSRMSPAVDWILQQPDRPKLAISAGFSGALESDYHIADIVAATEVVAGHCRYGAVSWPEWLPDLSPPIRRGKLLCLDSLVSQPDQKRQLGREYGAVAVDMETAAIAQHCRDMSVSFGCIRAISDTVDAGLPPELVGMAADGNVSLPQVLGKIVRRPALVKRFWILGRDTRRAANRLAEVLCKLLWPE